MKINLQGKKLHQQFVNGSVNFQHHIEVLKARETEKINSLYIFKNNKFNKRKLIQIICVNLENLHFDSTKQTVIKFQM